MRSSEYFGEAAQLGERLGVPRMAVASNAVYCATLQEIGAWDDALRIADELIQQLGIRSASYFEYHPRASRAHIRLARDEPDELVLTDIRRAADVARAAKDSQARVPALAKLIFVTTELGLSSEALDAWEELESVLIDASPIAVHRTLYAAFFARQLDCVDPLRGLLDSARNPNQWHEAVLALLEADFEGAANVLAAMAHVDEGYARLRAGETYLAQGRRADAEVQLRGAIAHYRPLRGARYTRRAEKLLGDAGLVRSSPQ